MIRFGITQLVLLLVSIVVLAGVALGLHHHFSADAREARRRGRSYKQVISRKRGPSVRLAVKGDKPKPRRKR